MNKYDELVELLDEVGVLQLEDEWAVQIQDLIGSHRINDSGADENN